MASKPHWWLGMALVVAGAIAVVYASAQVPVAGGRHDPVLEHAARRSGAHGRRSGRQGRHGPCRPRARSQ